MVIRERSQAQAQGGGEGKGPRVSGEKGSPPQPQCRAPGSQTLTGGAQRPAAQRCLSLGSSPIKWEDTGVSSRVVGRKG